MSDRDCEQIEGLLVDYADDELPADDRRQVEAHLASCPHCLTLLQALQRSGALVGAVWDETYDGVADLRPMDVVPQRQRRWIAYGGAAVAAAVALALLAVLTGRVLVVPTRQSAPAPGVRQEPLIAAGPQLTPERIRRSVDAAGVSVALLATVDWLAEQPANREIAREQYEFIAHMYAGSEVAAKARSRLAAIQQRSS
jgi:hypothetical protein